MKLKANLHFHTKEDPQDCIDYNLFDGIDRAIELGFGVLAVTCHNKFVVKDHHKKYADKIGICLIPGIEVDVYEEGEKSRSHVVILGCDKMAENIHTFDDLKKYKEKHPEIFVLAPHPYFFEQVSLNWRLEKYIDLFDAIELSWFYTTWFNSNVRAAKSAEKFNKPLIATSDTHILRYLDTSFTHIEAEEKSQEAIFKALTSFQHKNTTTPLSLSETIFFLVYCEPSMLYKRLIRDISLYFKSRKKPVKVYQENEIRN